MSIRKNIFELRKQILEERKRLNEREDLLNQQEEEEDERISKALDQIYLEQNPQYQIAKRRIAKQKTIMDNETKDFYNTNDERCMMYDHHT